MVKERNESSDSEVATLGIYQNSLISSYWCLVLQSDDIILMKRASKHCLSDDSSSSEVKVAQCFIPR